RWLRKSGRGRGFPGIPQATLHRRVPRTGLNHGLSIGNPMQDWSLPSSDGWSLLHDAALLYLTCMHGPDEEIDSSESAVVKELIRARGAGDAGVDRVYDEAMLMYVGTSGGEMIAASIASLGQSLTEKQRKELLLELARVATSDGI